MITAKILINRAFKNLRKAGYFAKQDFWCCQSCGWSAVPEGVEKVVFYHNQDADRFKKSGELMLAWEGDGAEIVNIFENEGLKVEWNGDPDTRIAVMGIADPYVYRANLNPRARA